MSEDRKVKVKIRHEKDSEAVLLCHVSGPDSVEGVVKSLSRAGGVIVTKGGTHSIPAEPSAQLRYDFILTDKEFYAEIVVHSDEPKA